MIKAMFTLLSIVLFSTTSFSQDGLDENSFDSPASQNSDENIPIDPGMDDSDAQAPTNDPLNNKIDLPADSQPTILDQGVIPDEFNDTSQGLSLNPAVDALKQEYYPSFIYDDRGRKDPFAPAIQSVEKVVTEDRIDDQDQKIREGLSKFEVSSLKVSAILIGKGKPKALLRDPSGVVYVIHENDIVGRNNGVVKKIRPSQIVIVEARDQKDGDRLYTTQILSVAK